MDRIAVLVTAETDADLGALRSACAQHGLANIEVLANIGVLRGNADAARLAELERIPGVKAVERSGAVRTLHRPD